MNESSPSVSFRNLLFGGVLVLAFALRLANLGASPLSDKEAHEALWAAVGTPAASDFWPSEGASPASSALYQSIAWVVFQLGGGSEATARLLPALIGALIVLAPWLLRRRLGTAGALLAAFLLAISPTLVAISRIAGGTSAAIVAVALGTAGLILVLDGELEPRRATALLATCLAVGLTAGAATFFGLVSLGGAAGLMLVTAPHLWPGRRAAGLRSILSRALGIGAAGAVVIALAAGWLPGGLASLAEGARSWLLGWIGPGEMHSLTPLPMVLAYEPLVVVFGIIGAVSAFRRQDAVGVGAAWWAILALALAVAYPGRSGELVAWCAVPLAWLAGSTLAWEAERLWSQPSRWQASGVGALLLFLLVYAGLQLASYASGIGPGFAQLNPELRLTVAAGAVAIVGVAAVLIGFGWSWSVARSGAVLAWTGALLILTLFAGWRLNFVYWESGPPELWEVSAPTRGLARLESTVESLSISARGVRDELPIAIDDSSPPPSLIWALRSFPRFSTSDSGSAESPPILVMRDLGSVPSLPVDYLGQSIVLGQTWDFAGPLPPDWLGWLWRRRFPVREATWVLLVRADVATHGESEVSETQP